jgi:hypothetical protein
MMCACVFVLLLQTVEGQFGDINAIIIAKSAPSKSAQSIKFVIKPLSLHHRYDHHYQLCTCTLTRGDAEAHKRERQSCEYAARVQLTHSQGRAQQYTHTHILPSTYGHTCAAYWCTVATGARAVCTANAITRVRVVPSWIAFH